MEGLVDICCKMEFFSIRFVSSLIVGSILYATAEDGSWKFKHKTKSKYPEVIHILARKEMESIRNVYNVQSIHSRWPLATKTAQRYEKILLASNAQKIRIIVRMG